jgi:predicted lipoprotein with Yx(FWY)xxD motif
VNKANTSTKEQEMIRTFALLRAHGRHPRLLLAALAAAAATVVAACGTSGGPSAGPYGPAPSSAPGAHAMTAGGPALTARHTALGTILTTGRGFTVYVFGADQGTRSACFGACAAAWPPVTTTSTHITLAGGAARLLVGQTTRPGGQRQLTYAGHPLYTFAGDTSPGVANGQGSDAFGARWDVLLPAGKEVSGG